MCASLPDCSFPSVESDKSQIHMDCCLLQLALFSHVLLLALEVIESLTMEEQKKPTKLFASSANAQMHHINSCVVCWATITASCGPTAVSSTCKLVHSRGSYAWNETFTCQPSSHTSLLPLALHNTRCILMPLVQGAGSACVDLCLSPAHDLGLVLNPKF